MNRENRLSTFLFWAMLIITMFPVWRYNWFMTFDGPAHLYNAHLLKNVLFGESDLFFQFHSLNLVPMPNLLGHIFLVCCDIVFPPFISEKILITVCIVVLVFSIRKLVKRNAGNTEMISLIIPFVLSYPLLLGFYNFCLGLSLYFFVVLHWQILKQSSKIKRIVMMMPLLSLVYLSHLFVFIWLLITLFILIILEERKNRSLLLSSFVVLAIAAIPGVLGALYFFFYSSTGLDTERLSFTQLLEDLWIVRPLIALDFAHEGIYAKITGTLIGVLLITGFFYLMKYKHKHTTVTLFGLLSFFLLILYFALPDKLAGGGYVSLRTSLLFFLSIIIWLSFCPFPRWCLITLQFIVLSLVLFRMSYIKKAIAVQSWHAKELYSITESLEDNTVILPLNFSPDWYETNIMHILGARKNIILLYNYEAELPYFPVLWKNETHPKRQKLNILYDHCGGFTNYEHISGVKIDAVVFWRFPFYAQDSCEKNALKSVCDKFDLHTVSKFGNALLFKRK